MGQIFKLGSACVAFQLLLQSKKKKQKQKTAKEKGSLNTNRASSIHYSVCVTGGWAVLRKILSNALLKSLPSLFLDPQMTLLSASSLWSVSAS